MELYHGSYMTIPSPEIIKGRFTKDFGEGFYCTKIYNYVADFMNGVLTREQFWVLAKFKYPTHQINFCTSKALAHITYKGYEEIKP